jgi:hypothetical protein
MQISTDARIPFPVPVVFAAYRDDLTKLLPYLPNVRSIEVKSRRDAGTTVEFVNEWRGGGDIPAAVRAVLSEAILSWTDYATWSATEHACDWRIQTHAFSDAVQCGGRNRFMEDGAGATRLEVRGTLSIDAKKIRGVPSLLASTVGRAAEDFLVNKIQSNLVETAQGLAKYLGEKAAAQTIDMTRR